MGRTDAALREEPRRCPQVQRECEQRLQTLRSEDDSALRDFVVFDKRSQLCKLNRLRQRE